MALMLLYSRSNDCVYNNASAVSGSLAWPGPLVMALTSLNGLEYSHKLYCKLFKKYKKKSKIFAFAF